MRDRTNIRDALENHEENKNKDLSSTICEFVSLECTPQVRYTLLHVIRALNVRILSLGGVLPYMGYIGTCRGIGYGF